MKRILIYFLCLLGLAAHAQVMKATQASTVSGGGPAYTILRTVSISFTSEFGALPTPPRYWNQAPVSTANIQVDNNYTLGTIVTETNAATTWTMNEVTHWSSTTESENVHSGGPDSSLYPDLITRSAWSWDLTGSNPTIRFNNLDPTKWYQIWYLSNIVPGYSSVMRLSVGAINGTTITATNNYGVKGSNEFTSGTLGLVKNVQCDGTGHLLITVNSISGFRVDLGTISIQETNIANPL